MSNPDPAFLLYVRDLLSSQTVTLMSLEQVGAYLFLLCHQWIDDHCSLPDDDAALSVLSRMGEGWFNGGSALVRECFEPHPEIDGRICNPRLYKESLERKGWREKSREGGLKSAETRRKKKEKGGSKGGSTTLATKGQPKGNPSSSSSSSLKDPPKSPQGDSVEPLCGVDADDPVILIFPVRGKGKTWDLHRSKITEYIENYPGLSVDAEMRKALQWARDNPRKRKTATGMAAYLTRWLNNACNRSVPVNGLGGNGQSSVPQHGHSPDLDRFLKESSSEVVKL